MLVSGFALAEQSLSGDVISLFHTGDVYDKNHFRIADTQLNWQAVKTMDSGFDATIRIEIDGDSVDSAAELDDTGVSLSGDFGTVAFGTFDHAAKSFATYSASVAAGTGGNDGHPGTSFSAYLNPFSTGASASIPQLEDFVNLSYLSNDFSGLNFGVSMISTGGVASTTRSTITRTGTAFGGAYSTGFGKNSLEVRFGQSDIKVNVYRARVAQNRKLSSLVKEYPKPISV